MTYTTNKSFDKAYLSLIYFEELSKKDSYVAKFNIAKTITIHDVLKKQFMDNYIANKIFIDFIKSINHMHLAYSVVISNILMIIHAIKYKEDSFYLAHELLTEDDVKYLEKYQYKIDTVVDTEEKMIEFEKLIFEIENLDIFKRYYNICLNMVKNRKKFNNYALIANNSTISSDFENFVLFSLKSKFHLITLIKFKDEMPRLSKNNNVDLISSIIMDPQINKINLINTSRSKHLKYLTKSCLGFFIIIGIIVISLYILFNI